MSEESLGAILETESQTEETRSFIKQVRRITGRKFTPEEKIRIVLEGFRHEVPIRDLCRREGIRPSTYYTWLKALYLAGKLGFGRLDVKQCDIVNPRPARNKAFPGSGGIQTEGTDNAHLRNDDSIIETVNRSNLLNLLFKHGSNCLNLVSFPCLSR